jgi:ABC-type transport system involved in Fe-S cluster assembly fused permease/ATPase subunit
MYVAPEIDVPPGTITAIVSRYGLGTSTVARLAHSGSSHTIN